MYLVTAGMVDSLTLNTPYPDCQANLRWPLRCIHLQELVLITRIISAVEWTGRMRINIWTWSAMPLTISAVSPSSRTMPPRYAKRSGRISSELGDTALIVNGIADHVH